MKWHSIRTKVLVALLACLVLGVGGILALMHYSFERNSRIMASESVSGANKLFNILEAREISKMKAVSKVLMANPEVRDAFVAKDRIRLSALAAALYPDLKKEGITNWVFHTPEPNMAVFLRAHNPAKFDDHLNRYIDAEVARTHEIVTGNELAKAGFAVRIIRPFYDSKGGITGYVEFGEELGQFIHAMKKQTGDDYALLLSKQFVDRQFWADSCAVWKRRDNYNDHPGFVVADKTTDSERIIQLDGELTSVPQDGKVLERFRSGKAVFVRGIFPIHDAAGKVVGAMFVVRDISSFHVAMKGTETILILVTVAALAIGIALVLMLLTNLIFRRLDHIFGIATRVVGGDYELEIQVSSDDEVGQFERLFEQFRRVFLDVLTHVPELQERG
jgi:HAMP domain-containing protein